MIKQGILLKAFYKSGLLLIAKEIPSDKEITSSHLTLFSPEKGDLPPQELVDHESQAGCFKFFSPALTRDIW